MLCFWCAFGALGGEFELKLGARKAGFITSLIAFGSCSLTYFTCYNFYLTTLTFGLLLGFSMSLAYTPPIVVALRWWPHSRYVVIMCDQNIIVIPSIYCIFVYFYNIEHWQVLQLQLVQV